MKTLLFISLLSIIILAILLTQINKYIFPEFKENFNNYVDNSDYDIQEIPHFFTDAECDALIERAMNNLEDSKVYNGENTDIVAKVNRDSKQAWLYDTDPFIKGLTDKIKDFTNTHQHHYEEFQVVKYGVGGFFKPHYDACDGDENYCKKMDLGTGPRYLTVLIYLNDVPNGGHTVFPHINKSVKPEKGKAVIFKNVNENGQLISQSFHGGEPVKDGEKWIANKWIHLKKIT
jgi:prolyl 4-hydroxylase